MRKVRAKSLWRYALERMKEIEPELISTTYRRHNKSGQIVAPTLQMLYRRVKRDYTRGRLKLERAA